MNKRPVNRLQAAFHGWVKPIAIVPMQSLLARHR